MQGIYLLVISNMSKYVKSNTEIKIIIACFIGGLLVYFIPYLINEIKYSEESIKCEFKTGKDSTFVKDSKITNLKGIHNNGYFIITGELYSKYNGNMDITFDLYDKDNFIISQGYTYLELVENEKYKINVYYDMADAKDVVNFKIRNINCY